MNRTRFTMNRAKGMSLVELLVVVALMGVMLGVGGIYFTTNEVSLQGATELVERFLRHARGKAMATTSAYRVSALDNRQLQALFSTNCSSASWTVDSALSFELPEKVTLTDTTWTVCFSSRGISSNNLLVGLSHPESGTRQVEVMLGGTTRIVP